jgi:hypothetical protein
MKKMKQLRYSISVMYIITLQMSLTTQKTKKKKSLFKINSIDIAAENNRGLERKIMKQKSSGGKSFSERPSTTICREASFITKGYICS